LGSWAKEIAKKLGLKDWKIYKGHSFRRSMASILAETGISLLELKQHGRWKSDRVAQGYIDDSDYAALNRAKLFNFDENDYIYIRRRNNKRKLSIEIFSQIDEETHIIKKRKLNREIVHRSSQNSSETLPQSPPQYPPQNPPQHPPQNPPQNPTQYPPLPPQQYPLLPQNPTQYPPLHPQYPPYYPPPHLQPQYPQYPPYYPPPQYSYNQYYPHYSYYPLPPLQ